MKIFIISYVAFISMILYANKDVLTGLQMLYICLPIALSVCWGIWHAKRQPTMGDVLFGAIETAKQLSRGEIVGQVEFDTHFPKSIEAARKARVPN